MALSQEFSVDEYDPNEESTNARNVFQSLTSVSSGRQTNNLAQDETPIANIKEIKSVSPFRRVAHHISQDRFALVTSENQLTLNVNKVCCACGCMSRIGKDNLQSLRHYYFSVTGDEQETYPMTHLQMVSNKTSDMSISFEYFLFMAQQCCRVAFKISQCVSNMRLHRVQQ